MFACGGAVSLIKLESWKEQAARQAIRLSARFYNKREECPGKKASSCPSSKVRFACFSACTQNWISAPTYMFIRCQREFLSSIRLNKCENRSDELRSISASHIGLMFGVFNWIFSNPVFGFVLKLPGIASVSTNKGSEGDFLRNDMDMT